MPFKTVKNFKDSDLKKGVYDQKVTSANIN